MSSLSSTDAPLMLSVSGARGIVGRTMTPVVAAEFAAAFGSHCRHQVGQTHPVIVIGRDPRPSGPMLAAAAAAGLASVGAAVVDVGVVPTPTVGLMVREHGAAGGLVVTASHNPIEWNGIKCIDDEGAAPPPPDAAAIIERFRTRDFTQVGVRTIQPFTTDDSALATHVERVIAQVDVAAIRKRSFTVVVDSVNGAGCAATRLLLELLGCTLVHLNGEPTGRFAHPPEPVETHLTELAERTGAAGAACGFAQDPDADRLAIVDERGRYIGEEQTLVLAAKCVLDGRGPGVLAANLSTSRMLDDLAAGYPGSSVVRTAVGEANVAAALRAAGDAARIGGEGNGGVIDPAIGWIRDSVAALALILDLLARDGRPLSQLVTDHPSYAMIKRKIDLGSVGGRAAVEAALDAVTTCLPDASVDRTDGVRLDLSSSWIHVRASNTEPILRLIAEASSVAEAESLIDRVTTAAGLG